METKKTTISSDISLVLLASLLSLLFMKIPAILQHTGWDENFYTKNTALIVFFGMSVYVLLSNGLNKSSHWLWIALGFVLPAAFINFLPNVLHNDVVMLSCLHLPLLLWCLYGLVYLKLDISKANRMEYIRYNGDLLILSGIILAAGGLFSLLTIGLFNIMGFRIEEFYFQNIGLWGMVSAPIVATYLIKNHKSITNKIAPILANIFSPMVLVMLLLFLISFPFSTKDPYNDRNFLLIFNLLLLCVTALIVFSISEISKNKHPQFSKVVLSLMSIAALVVNSIALIAILYRLSEYGFTPNRTAVLGANLLLFIHLFWIAFKLFKVAFLKKELNTVENAVTTFLPVYAVWTVLVVIGFPLLFGFH